MNDPRDLMLRGIRRGLNRTGPLPSSVTRALAARLRRPTANIKPKLASEPVEHFLAKLEAVNTKVSRLPDLDKVSATVGRHLKAHRLGSSLVVAPDPDLAPVRWSNRLRVERRAALGGDRVSVTSAFAGVAETGSLVLLSGVESPTTLNFLPEDHIVVLFADRILTHLEDVWPRLRKAHPRMPRTVNLITGPSKTADVEQTLQEGAHGPRRLHVILIGDA